MARSGGGSFSINIKATQELNSGIDLFMRAVDFAHSNPELAAVLGMDPEVVDIVNDNYDELKAFGGAVSSAVGDGVLTQKEIVEVGKIAAEFWGEEMPEINLSFVLRLLSEISGGHFQDVLESLGFEL